MAIYNKANLAIEMKLTQKKLRMVDTWNGDNDNRKLSIFKL